jgi:protein-tyrosine phosphatase
MTPEQHKTVLDALKDSLGAFTGSDQVSPVNGLRDAIAIMEADQPAHAIERLLRNSANAWVGVDSRWLSDGNFQYDLIEQPLAMVHVPEADCGGKSIDAVLMRQALDALEYHMEQTRPITRTSEAIDALRVRLGVV